MDKDPSMVFESSLNVTPDVDSVSSNTSMLNDVEVATDLNTTPCSSQVLSSSDVPEAELNSSNMSTTTETQSLDLSEVPEVEPNPSVLCTPPSKRQNKKAIAFQRKVFDINSLLSKRKKNKESSKSNWRQFYTYKYVVGIIYRVLQEIN